MELNDLGRPEVRPQQGDEALAVRFYNRREVDHVATEKKGRKVERVTPCIQINFAGDRTSEFHDRLKNQERIDYWSSRFPQHWEMFQRSQDAASEQINGSPIEVMGIPQARCEELRYLNVYTVEQLANMNEGLLDRLGGDGRNLQVQAQQYLQNCEAAANQALYAKELEKRDLEIASLHEKIDALLKQAGDPDTKPAKGGRKPKAA